MTDDAADRLAVRELVDIYADAVNRRDGDAWEATWAPDGVWDLSGHRVEGREALRPFWEQAMSGLPFVVQLVHSGVVEIDGDSASGRWWLTERMQMPDGSGNLVIGRYDDTCTRLDGRWHFAQRVFQVQYRGSPDMSGTVS